MCHQLQNKLRSKSSSLFSLPAIPWLNWDGQKGKRYGEGEREMRKGSCGGEMEGEEGRVWGWTVSLTLSSVFWMGPSVTNTPLDSLVTLQGRENERSSYVIILEYVKVCPNVCVECHNIGMVYHPYLVKLFPEENYIPECTWHIDRLCHWWNLDQ